MRTLRSTLALFAVVAVVSSCGSGSDSPQTPGNSEPSVALQTPPEFVSAAAWTSQQSPETKGLQWVSNSSVVEYRGRVWMVMSAQKEQAQIVGISPQPPFDAVASEPFSAFVGPDDYDGDTADPMTLPLLTVTDGVLAVTYRTPDPSSADLNYQRFIVAPGGVTQAGEPSTLGIPDPVVRSTGTDLIAFNGQEQMLERWRVVDHEWQREHQQMFGGDIYYPQGYVGQEPVYVNTGMPEVFFRGSPYRVYDYDTGAAATVTAAADQGAIVVTTGTPQFLDVRGGQVSVTEVSPEPACQGIAAPVRDPDTGYMAVDGPALWDVGNHQVTPISVQGNCPVAIALSGKQAWVSQQGETGFTVDTRQIASGVLRRGQPWPSRTRGPLYVTNGYGFFPLADGNREQIAVARLKP